MSTTHSITNQPPPLVDHDVAADPPLLEGLRRAGADWAEDELRALGRRAGAEEVRRWSRLVEESPPTLHTHDRYGHRIDEVEFHPHWHDLMETAVRAGVHAAPWRDERPGAHAARAAKLYVWAQTDPGHLCPISMTYAAVPALRTTPELAARYEPLLTTHSYDYGLREPSAKRGLIAGMSMTEKQGGSDVRANTTTATPTGDGTHTLVGHKWFTSAPMSDLFLTLAQAPGGLSCFVLPRVLPDDTRNPIRLQRLKNKLGNRSNASAEIEYEDARGWLVGEEGRGVATIIQMVNATRLDCLLSSAATMRQAVLLAVHHATHRSAFGARLVDQPLMENVLADLAIEAEAAVTVGLRLAGAVDRATAGDDQEALFRRIGLAVSKYWVCKRAPAHTAEALECLGGNGYVEESGMPRLFRESPLSSIWEGSGNVAALDVLRAMAREPACVDTFFTEVGHATGGDPRLDAAVARLRTELSDPREAEFRARRMVGLMATVLQGSLLVRHAPAAVADAFCASRLGLAPPATFGTLPTGLSTRPILERAYVTG